jgi:hypothetical protein
MMLIGLAASGSNATPILRGSESIVRFVHGAGRNEKVYRRRENGRLRPKAGDKSKFENGGFQRVEGSLERSPTANYSRAFAVGDRSNKESPAEAGLPLIRCGRSIRRFSLSFA